MGKKSNSIGGGTLNLNPVHPKRPKANTATELYNILVFPP